MQYKFEWKHAIEASYDVHNVRTHITFSSCKFLAICMKYCNACRLFSNAHYAPIHSLASRSAAIIQLVIFFALSTLSRLFSRSIQFAMQNWTAFIFIFHFWHACSACMFIILFIFILAPIHKKWPKFCFRVRVHVCSLLSNVGLLMWPSRCSERWLTKKKIPGETDNFYRIKADFCFCGKKKLSSFLYWCFVRTRIFKSDL